MLDGMQVPHQSLSRRGGRRRVAGVKHRLMALLACYLCLFGSAHAQWYLPNSSHPFLSNTDGRKFAITLVAILVGTFVVLSIIASLTERRHNRDLPRKNNGATSKRRGRNNLKLRKRNEPARSAEQS